MQVKIEPATYQELSNLLITSHLSDYFWIHTMQTMTENVRKGNEQKNKPKLISFML